MLSGWIFLIEKATRKCYTFFFTFLKNVLMDGCLKMKLRIKNMSMSSDKPVKVATEN